MSRPRLTLIARADNTGLGNQTWEFYRHMKPQRVFIIDLTDINHANGKATVNHFERYEGAHIIKGFPTVEDVEEILRDTDVVFTVEIPYNYHLFKRAREKGVKTVLQYNFEFLDYLQDTTLPHPDLFLAPSLWNYSRATHVLGDDHLRYLHVPTNRDVLPYRQRTQAKTFIHVAGYPAHMDRNGTDVVLDALGHITAPVNVVIYSQAQAGQIQARINHDYQHGIIKPGVKATVVVKDFENYWDIFTQPDQDVLLLPRRYGGLSLQLNEALSVGMPVLMTDVPPQNRFLPETFLIPTIKAEGITIHTRAEIKCHKPNAVALAQRIDDLYNMPQLVNQMSFQANEIAIERSWEIMLPKYQKVLEVLCQG